MGPGPGEDRPDGRNIYSHPVSRDHTPEFMSDTATIRVPAQAHVFGFEPTEVALEVEPRTTAWRATRAGVLAGGGIVLAPIVMVLPPHVAWALGSVVTGGLLGWRKWVERFTLISVEGACPKCAAALSLESPTRLRARSTLSCPDCQHDLQVIVEDGTPV